MLVLGMVWAEMKLIGPSSGSLLSSSTYVSMTVIRNRGEETGEEAVDRKQKEGNREADG